VFIAESRGFQANAQEAASRVPGQWAKLSASRLATSTWLAGKPAVFVRRQKGHHLGADRPPAPSRCNRWSVLRPLQEDSTVLDPCLLPTGGTADCSGPGGTIKVKRYRLRADRTSVTHPAVVTGPALPASRARLADARVGAAPIPEPRDQTAQVIEELIQLAKDVRAAQACGRSERRDRVLRRA
jgi:hypothetical protein